MVGSRRRKPRPYTCMSCSGRKAAKTSCRSAPLSLTRGSSSWLRAKTALGASCGLSGRPISAEQMGPGSSRASARYMACMVGKSHGQFVAVAVPEERTFPVVRQVDLAEQDGVAVPAGEERAQVAQEVVRLREGGGAPADAGGFRQEGH